MLFRSFGATVNPWSPGHTPGGSSGGAGAAVAAGLGPLAIGTDGGGSIRIPSSLCGVSGLKPTQGRLSGDPLKSSVVVLGPIGAIDVPPRRRD